MRMNLTEIVDHTVKGPPQVTAAISSRRAQITFKSILNKVKFNQNGLLQLLSLAIKKKTKQTKTKKPHQKPQTRKPTQNQTELD